MEALAGWLQGKPHRVASRVSDIEWAVKKYSPLLLFWANESLGFHYI